MPMEMNALLVLLIEDDMDLAATVGDYLSFENIECDYAFNGQVGLDSALKNQYDLILLDLTLPKVDGLTVCEQLRAQNVTCPILMLTARDAVSDRVAGFEAGADDYLIKPFAFPELAVRIRALVRRSKGHSTSVTIGDLEVNLSARQASRAGRKLKLSPTGWILLEQLVRSTPNVLSKQELERAVWGDQVPASDSLKVHLYKLRRQLQRPYETQLLHTVAGHGFALRT
ncbi:DNA-binding response regulator, OmpR family, contains REC and winged-helix (wHTH) domain [Pseudovibrio denitrificans]|uniref:Cell cycle response regulator CtrA n=1 Tax=Pseudovibrio denitrificans TaxID=258256 RepID=A0A1I6Z7C6_9HYPH|nr:response regulator transcription factor [Pseudovibrio denitrificans]SFT58331.1 DNA-binding response regulator, OmpR family, contains REC and winged-helix (wHTH) domain [Pseudovibrio denitrificans]